MQANYKTMDGNEAAAHIAFKTNEVISIYPITPASPMGEWADLWTSKKQPNIWGTVPSVVELQSEGGAAGTVHGSLQNGALTTTFTASQGLLLMIPNMYKIAGELTPTVFHIAARSLAAQALSIFGDHSDVMAARQTGWAMLFANSVQEVHDFALISHAATLETRIPFLHIFDGFRTSHEISKIQMIPDEVIKALISNDRVREHRARGMNPDNPFIRGTAQNPDVYFQARESGNPFYNATPTAVQDIMDRFYALTNRRYHLFEYIGAEDAERVIVVMGSGAETVEETVKTLTNKGEKVGVLKVRLYRPFSIEYFLQALPTTVRSISVLDRTKEPGSSGEPLYKDILSALSESFMSGRLPMETLPKVVGGRYGLSSKEFTPAMVKGIFDELKKEQPKNNYTVGIVDDVTHTSLSYDPSFTIESASVKRAVFWGLGSDGTVGANKNSIKIIGEETELYAQGYFVYDSKKSGARTISHLRFGPNPIRSTYLIEEADFVGVHQFGFLSRYDTLKLAGKGAKVLLNSPHPADEVWEYLPAKVQNQIIEKQLTVYVVDAYKVAREVGLGMRFNTVMQTCFFALSEILPKEQAISKIKDYIKKTYGKRGDAVVQMNFNAVDAALSHLFEVTIPTEALSEVTVDEQGHLEGLPSFLREVTLPILDGNGDDLPVSKLPVDGTYPSGTTRIEKRNIALQVPEWDADICIQCGKCVMVCPHSVIRAKIIEPDLLTQAPSSFKTAQPKWKEFSDKQYALQVAVEDCTGCSLCVEVCPAKSKSNVSHKAINMVNQAPLVEQERENWNFFEGLPTIKEIVEDDFEFSKTKDVQLLDPYFEFSSACAGCGETPYIRLLTQLFGDRMVVANATGCSSIYGGNLPTTPWAKDKHGRGPTWNNSLFEDNAEFGLGMRLALDKQREYAFELLQREEMNLPEALVGSLVSNQQREESELHRARTQVDQLKSVLKERTDEASRDLLALSDHFVKRSLWIIGGDGWAYDIGFGGLDHVLASGHNVNVLVLDTEVYSNTGGQASKSTGLGAIAKFAAGGKPTGKKDLGKMLMSYGHVYVAQVAMGANENQVIKAMREAEAYDGPSIIIAYSHCIAHGYDLAKGMEQQKLAAETGYFPTYRYNPDLRALGKNPLILDAKKPKKGVKQFIYNEQRYKLLERTNPAQAETFLKAAQQAIDDRWIDYKYLSDEDHSNDSHS